MQRTVTTPADLNGEALDDLKRWLAISRASEDSLLVDLLGTSLALCEAFTGQAPIEQTVEERTPVTAGEYALTTRSIRALVSVELVEQDGNRLPIAESDYTFEVDAYDTACFRLHAALEGRCIAIAVRAGIASDWAALPDALKQGAIRLAAYHYRDRDNPRATPPPASITALWRPWRSLRIV